MILIIECVIHTLRVRKKNIMTGNVSVFFVYFFASSVFPFSFIKKTNKQKLTEASVTA